MVSVRPRKRPSYPLIDVTAAWKDEISESELVHFIRLGQLHCYVYLEGRKVVYGEPLSPEYADEDAIEEDDFEINADGTIDKDAGIEDLPPNYYQLMPNDA